MSRSPCVSAGSSSSRCQLIAHGRRHGRRRRCPARSRDRSGRGEGLAMIRTIVAARGLVAMSVAAVAGTWGVFVHPVDVENPFLGLIALQNPQVFRVLTYGYATLWF